MSANPLQLNHAVESDVIAVYPVIMEEELTDEEARIYADLLTPEEAREELQRLLNETDD